MRRHLRIATTLAAVLAGGRVAGAQDLQTYVGGAFTVATWGVASTANQGPSLTFKNESGATVTTGVVGEAGRFLTPHFAVGFEIGGAFRRRLTQTFGPFGPEQEVTYWTFGATGGVDLSVDVAPHVSLVPQLRFVATQRGQLGFGQSFANFGLNTVDYRAGLGLRAVF